MSLPQSLSVENCRRVQNHLPRLPRRAVFRIDFDAMWRRASHGGRACLLCCMQCTMRGVCVRACVCVYVLMHAG